MHLLEELPSDHLTIPERSFYLAVNALHWRSDSGHIGREANLLEKTSNLI